jgi:hypothetical protein
LCTAAVREEKVKETIVRRSEIAHESMATREALSHTRGGTDSGLLVYTL